MHADSGGSVGQQEKIQPTWLIRKSLIAREILDGSVNAWIYIVITLKTVQ
jgi:hypothetical protein